ncbi:binding partner of ACD11 1-like isoform X2 [Typha angustifolia]|uniref:binding partner of ACD11 1-like isoform X2 n=1 Tax=Typha angustifolia TaxID=59011 RepID=UPI003C2D3892
MSVRTVKVSNVSLRASPQEIEEFFSFSGDILYVEMQPLEESSQVAYITFRDSEGVETALLLSGATIIDMSVIITPAMDYELPAAALAAPTSEERKPVGGAQSAFQKAEDIVNAMLAKGFILGKDALNKAKVFDEKHRLTSAATARVSTFDKRIGLSEKISAGTSAVNEKVREMDQKFQVSEKTKSAIVAAEQKVTTVNEKVKEMNQKFQVSGKTKSAIAAAEQKVTSVNEKVKEMDQKFQVSEKTKSAIAVAEQKVGTAGSVFLNNRYVLTGTSWFRGALSKVVAAASYVGSKGKKNSVAVQEKEVVENGFADGSISESTEVPPNEHSNGTVDEQSEKPKPVQVV